MTFIEFVQSSPGMTGYAVEMYRVMDREAAKIGAALSERYEFTSELRYEAERLTRLGLESLAAQKTAMADALERDQSGKLAAVPSLRAWASGPDGIGQTWVNWFVTYYNAYLDAQRAPKIVPMMAAE